MKAILFITLLFFSYCHNLQGGEQQLHQNNSTGHLHQHNSTEYKTFLVKTKLTKEQLEQLLKEGEQETVNLKKTNKTDNNTVIIQDVNSTNVTDGSLEKKIEQEIREDALHPIDEFHVNKNEVKTLVTTTTPNTRFIDSLYEKKFSKFWGYLTLILFFYVMIQYKDAIFNQKRINVKKPYINNFNYNNEKEYMLVKNN